MVNLALLAQLDRVTGYEPVGQGFESLTARQKKSLSFWTDSFSFVWGLEPEMGVKKLRSNALNDRETVRWTVSTFLQRSEATAIKSLTFSAPEDSSFY